MSVSTSSDDGLLEQFLGGHKAGKAWTQEAQPDSDITTYNGLEYALYLCRGQKNTKGVQIDCKSDDGRQDSRLVVLDESVTKNFDDRVQNVYAKTPVEGGVHIRLVLMNRDNGTFLEDKSQTLTLFEKYWDIDIDDFALLTSQPVSSYHSRVVDVHGDVCLDITYNIREDILYDQDNIALETSLTANIMKAADMRVQREYEPVYFRHNISTGQTTYILPNVSREYRHLLHGIDAKLSETDSNVHPFTLHAIVLFQSLASRSMAIDDVLRQLLWTERQIYQGSIFQGEGESEIFIQYIRFLHNLSRNLITLEHRNQRDRSHIQKLICDHKRLWKLVKQCPHSNQHVDMRTHENVRDSLLSLKDSAHDQDQQIINAQRKTQLFITLLYNLITGHDSGINLRIASETAVLAHEAKKDSTSMKIIAGVTMFYLPATFVCSLFGTNFVALNTNTSEPTFIVSKLWWIYIAFAVPLTAATIMGFVVWRRWRRGSNVIYENRYDV